MYELSMNYYATKRNGVILNHSDIENCTQSLVGRNGHEQIGHLDMISFIQRLKF
jgi:hypothetical protein